MSYPERKPLNYSLIFIWNCELFCKRMPRLCLKSSQTSLSGKFFGWLPFGKSDSQRPADFGDNEFCYKNVPTPRVLQKLKLVDLSSRFYFDSTVCPIVRLERFFLLYTESKVKALNAGHKVSLLFQ